VWLRIDPRLSKPIYLQIVDGVKEAVAKQTLLNGERLPSVRELARTMTLNPNTVAKAYQELEREHVIDVVRGQGTFVAAPGSSTGQDQRIAVMQQLMKELWVEAQHLQMTSQDLLAMMETVVAEWDGQKGREYV